MAVNQYAQMDETQPGYPTLPPSSDLRWQAVVVHARSRDSGILCSLPRLKANFPIATVHAGDIVAVMPQVRYGVWVAAKLDYSTGWLNTIHLDFSPYEHNPYEFDTFADDDFETGNLETEPYPTAYGNRANPHYQAAQAVTTDFVDKMREIGTHMDQPEDTNKPDKGEVNKIIGYLKGLFGRG